MFNDFFDYLFLRKVLKKFKKPLRKMYSRRITKYNLRIVKLIYKNLSKRYSLSVKQIYNYLPLTVEIDKEMEMAYGLCEAGPVIVKHWFSKPVKIKKSKIYLNGIDVTTTTFIHEFGHYLRYLIAQIAMHRNKKAMEDLRSVADLVRSRASVAINKNDNVFNRGDFTEEEEENFAKSWEQYLKDGISPDKKHKRLFNNFRKYIFYDMNKRSERKTYEFYEDLEVRITPERKLFFDQLIIGKRLKKENIIIKILEWYIYIGSMFLIIKFLSKYF